MGVHVQYSMSLQPGQEQKQIRRLIPLETQSKAQIKKILSLLYAMDYRMLRDVYTFIQAYSTARQEQENAQ